MDISEARRMGTALLAEHGLAGWRLAFDRAKRRAGQCRYHDRVISLSAPLTAMHGEAEVRETLLHEIAHALVGSSAGHGPAWQETARRIGSTGDRCVSGDAPRVEGPWVGTCPAGHRTDRHRRPTRVVTCARCRSSFSPEHLLTWTFHGREAPMHPEYVAELDRLRTGRVHLPVRTGETVRITAPGRYDGVVGTVQRVARTRYHVAVTGAVLAVPMSAVEVVGRGQSSEASPKIRVATASNRSPGSSSARRTR